MSAVRSTGAPGVADYLSARVLAHRLLALRDAGVLVAAAPTGEGGWDVNGFAHGVLVAAERVPPDVRPGGAAGRVRDETVLVSREPTVEPDLVSLELIGQWLDGPGTRLVALDGTWACPLALAPPKPAAPPDAAAPLSVGSRPPSG